MNHKSGYRWIMMILTALPTVVVNCAQFQLSAYTTEFMEDFSLSLTQYSAVVFSYAIATGIVGIFAGTLEDKFGVKKVVVAGGIITTLASFIRLFSTNYVLFFIMSMLVGTLTGTGTAAIAKVSKAWFSEKERSLCVCIICMGGAVGVSIAQLAAPLFAGYRSALTFSTILSAVSTIAWIILGRDTDYGNVKSESIIRHLREVIRLKNVWLIAAGCAFFAAFMFGTTGLLPSVLVIDRGLTNTEAITATGMLNFAAIAGLVVMPMIQRWLGRYKPLLYFVCGISAICFAMIFIVPGWMIGVMVFIIGFFGGIVIGFYVAILSNLKEIKPGEMGSANGIVVMSQYILGSFFLSTYVLTPLADINGKYLYIADIILCILMLVISAMLPEVGEKVKRNGR